MIRAYMFGIFAAIGAVIGAVVAVVAAVAIAPAVIVGGVIGGIGYAVLCVTNAFNICPSSSGGGSSGSTPTTIVKGPGKGSFVPPGGGKGNGGKGGASNGNVNGSLCVSADNATCPLAHIHNTGTIVNGSCNATVPPNSACPAPLIGTGAFTASPAFIRPGSTATLTWNVTSATFCNLTGGGLSLTNLGIASQTQTNAISAKTTYTLTCLDGVGGPSSSAQTTVNLDPTYQEN
jgi:hypothetical protein